jgi:hypothetical protein
MVMALEEAVNDRVAVETEVLVTWAFEQGVAAGRSKKGASG